MAPVLVPSIRSPGYTSDSEDALCDLVDIEKYPIHQLDSPECQKLIATCQKSWRQYGSVSLPGFIKENLIEPMTHEVSDLPAHRRLYTQQLQRQQQTEEYAGQQINNPLQQQESAHPETTRKEVNGTSSDPAKRLLQMDIHAVPGDKVPRTLMLRKLYDSRQLARFFARVLDLKQEHVHQWHDPWQCLNVMYQYDAGQRSWHYDESDFVVTLKLQNAEDGGEFEYAPFIRGEEKVDQKGKRVFEERYDQVAALFDGTYTGPRIVSRSEPGSLNLFNGIRTLHRVRAVYGPKKRIMAVFSYDTHPLEEQPWAMREFNVRQYGERIRKLYVEEGEDDHNKEMRSSKQRKLEA